MACVASHVQRAALPSHRQEVEGSFAIRAEEQAIKASTLAVYGLQCKVAWAGDEPLDLPDEVEELLVDDELKDSRPGVRLLWATLLGIYPTEQARTVAHDTYYGQLHLLRPAALTVASCTQSYCVHTYDAYPADQAVHMRRSLCLHLLWPHFFTAPYTCCSCTCCAYTCCGRTYCGHAYCGVPPAQAAIAAVQRNSAIVLPYLNRPHHITGSWKVLTLTLTLTRTLTLTLTPTLTLTLTTATPHLGWLERARLG